jgi:hypothetical protein
MLINAVKDVTSALGDLMQATKSASGKNMAHPAMHTLKDTAKVGTDFGQAWNNILYLSCIISSFLKVGTYCECTVTVMRG